MEPDRPHRGVGAFLALALVAGAILFVASREGDAPATGHGKRTAHHLGTMEISIAAIDVKAKVIKLGLSPEGKLEVPTDFSQAGWWSGGTFPGRPGPAVIVGHIDSKSGPAVFYRLSRLKAGDEVRVWRKGKGTVAFVVDGLGQYPKARFPTDLVYGSTPNATLRLITCGGAFDHSTGHYVDNIIVFAHRSD